MSADNIFQQKFCRPKMFAVQVDPNNRKLSYIREDMPLITRPDDVIVKVAYAGICGTDIHIIAGIYPAAETPFILGHEFCGLVYALGSEVKKFKRCDRVVVDPNKGCGICKFCHSGKYNLCPSGSMNSALGIFRNGGWAQFCKVSAQQIYKLPDGVTFQQAVLLEPLSCIYHGFSRISPLDYSSNILVTGAGIAGNLWCCLLHHIGHCNVTISEPDEERRAINRKLGTGFTVVAPEELNNMFSSDGENGFDICIDCSGNGEVIENSIDLLNRGGKYCLFGLASKETRICISPYDIFLKELTIYGTSLNPYSFFSTIGLAETMGSRYLNFDQLGIKVYPLDKYDVAIEELIQKQILKGVFKVDPSV